MNLVVVTRHDLYETCKVTSYCPSAAALLCFNCYALRYVVIIQQFSEFTPVPSYGSVFVYMIPKQNVMPAQVKPARVHPGSCAGARFSSRHENSFRCHVNGV